jgi:hypothetical protein
VREPEAAAAQHRTPQDITLIGAATDAAARTFDTDPALLRGPERIRMVVDARAVAMTAARLNGLSLPKIAAEFGDRHHTVVLQTTRRIEKTPPLREIAERIAKALPAAENRPRQTGSTTYDADRAGHHDTGTRPAKQTHDEGHGMDDQLTATAKTLARWCYDRGVDGRSWGSIAGQRPGVGDAVRTSCRQGARSRRERAGTTAT